MTVHVGIVGAGIVGHAVGWALARRGATVTLIDDRPDRAAARVAAGMLAPVAETHEHAGAVIAVARAAADRWPVWADDLTAATGRAVGYAATGTLLVAADADQRALVDHHGRLLADLGLDAERVGGRAARRLEPALGPSVVGGWHLAGVHQGDPRAALDALAAALDDRGAQRVFERAVDVAPDRIVTDHGSRRFDHVVVAAGWASGPLLGLPVRPIKGQILRPAASAAAVMPTTVLRGTEVYIVPRPAPSLGGDRAEIVVGATVEDRGDERTVTAGGVRHLLREAHRLVPGLDEAELVETAAGLRPTTPDEQPILDTIDGVHVATGHYRNGVLLAPWTGEAVADAVLDGAWPSAAEPFRVRDHGPRPAPAPHRSGR